MSKRPLIATVLTVAALALLLSFKTPDAAGLSPLATSAGGSPGVKSNYTGQLTGNAIQIPFGTVQVQVTMQNGTITDVQALQLPNDQGHSAEISAYAGPQLRSEALQAQSAQIDTISGATYTSYGYQQSLQSALDQAH
ncbi:MAG: FMN-binding protein [Candidatus Limnocylindrales bacterium]|jgi:uncharacterized protein with FMN-binding domain